MNNTLYQQLFNRLKELGAIRIDLSFGCEVITSEGRRVNFVESIDYGGIIVDNGAPEYCYKLIEDESKDISIKELIGHPAILSDCLNAIHLVGGNGAVATTGKIIANLARTNRANGSYTEMQWDLSKSLLSQQSQELGEELLELLTD